MATKAFVLIETAVGKTKEVVDTLRKVRGVVSVDAVTGPYDIIAVLEADNLHAIGDLVAREIHTTAGITRTITCMAIDLS